MGGSLKALDGMAKFEMFLLLLMPVKKQVPLPRRQCKELLVGQAEVQARGRPKIIPILLVCYCCPAELSPASLSFFSGSLLEWIQAFVSASAILGAFLNVMRSVTSSSVISGCALSNPA